MEKKWYMITTISGKENTVIESLKHRVISENMSDDFDVDKGFVVMNIPYISPKELEKKQQNLAFKIKERNLYPGYIFVKMNMTNEAWFMVRNTQYVTGLVGSSGQRTKPTPVSSLEMKKMQTEVQRQIDDFKAGKIITPFVPGTVVEVIQGDAKGLVGSILENDDSRQFAIVEIVMFGQKRAVEIKHRDLKIKQ